MRDRLARALMFVVHLPLIVWFTLIERLGRWSRHSKLVALGGDAVRYVVNLPVRLWFTVVRLLGRWSRHSKLVALGGDAVRFVTQFPVIVFTAVFRRFGLWRKRAEAYLSMVEEAESSAEGRPPTRVRMTKALLLVPRLPLLTCSLTFGFVLDWFRSRVLRSMLWGLPCIVCAATILVVVWVGWRQRVTRVRLTARYLEAADEARKDERFDEAALFFRKVAYLDGSSTIATFGLAWVADLQGSIDQARQLMQSIAPEDGAGDARAHFWLARDLVNNNKPLGPEESKVLEHHLVQTVESHPGNVQAQEMLGKCYASMKQYDKADKHLAIAAQQRPVLLLPLIRVRQARGKEALAKRTAETARDHFLQQANSDPGKAEGWLLWGEAELLLKSDKSHQIAYKVLREGLQQSKDQRCRIAICRVFVDWFDKVQETREGATPTLLESLKQALWYSPNDPEALRRLATWVASADEDPDKVRRLLKGALAMGAAPETAHLILGAIALNQQDAKSASLHLEQAYRLNLQTAALLNNLASVFANLAPPQLERALTLADAAVKLDPDQPRLRYTRGYVLFKLERCEEARDDLEAVLPSLPDEPQLHRTLADVYEKLGDRERAAEYRRTAEEAEKTRKPLMNADER